MSIEHPTVDDDRKWSQSPRPKQRRLRFSRRRRYCCFIYLCVPHLDLYLLFVGRKVCTRPRFAANEIFGNPLNRATWFVSVWLWTCGLVECNTWQPGTHILIKLIDVCVRRARYYCYYQHYVDKHKRIGSWCQRRSARLHIPSRAVVVPTTCA